MTSTNHITNQNVLALQLVLTKVMARAMVMFFPRAVVKARQISRTIKYLKKILTILTNTAL